MATAVTSTNPFASAADHATAIRAHAATSQELTQFYLERIRTHNRALHALVISNEADALNTARRRDEDLQAGTVRGPLHGVPVTVKESFNISGLKTTVNHPPLRNNVAASDALIVRRLKDAGAVILGKTNIPRMLSDYQSFGPIYPTASNPYDLKRTPGGSSGGGAAAVAAGLTTLEIGSDIGGSIRVPAHFCGIFGLKPTENMAMHGEGHVPPTPASRGGFVAMASAGPLARTMTDIELAWSIINQPTWDYFFHLPSKPRAKDALDAYRIAWFDNAGEVTCGEETRRVLEAFVERLQGAGVTCDKQPFDEQWLADSYEVWGVLFGAIVAQDERWAVRQVLKLQFSRMLKGGAFGSVGSAVKRGLDLRFDTFSRAVRRRTALVQHLQRRFEQYDFIISPVAAGPAFPHNARHQRIELEGRRCAYMDYTAPFVAPYNACGNPVLVVPAGRTATGLPIGVQIAAPHYAEEELLQFGTLVERLGATFAPPDGY